MQKRDEILSFLRNLREEILQAFESLEGKSSFERKPWNHKTGGGGEMAVLRGNVFEKAAVNWSGVEGPQFPLQGEDSGPFFATGVSLITHMQSPHAPTVHMNLRYIETKNRAWLGGGMISLLWAFLMKKIHSISIRQLKKHSILWEQNSIPSFLKKRANIFSSPSK